MHTLNHARPLCNLSGEELLIIAIAGAPGARRRINDELGVRSLLAEGARRTRIAADRPRLRLSRTRAA